jgi:hypothetical protein
LTTRGESIEGDPFDPPSHLDRDLIYCAPHDMSGFLEGLAAVISLLPTPRGISPAKCFGIISGISGCPSDTTQIGNRLPTAQATSMPT